LKLPDHVNLIKTKIYNAFDKQFSRLGVGTKNISDISTLQEDLHNKRIKIDQLINSHIGETGTYKEAREKALDELTFTLFNRIAAIKVMESHSLFPPIIIKQSEHGDRSFGHKAWLEENPNMRSEELEGIREYLKDAFNSLGETIPLYNKDYPYAILPYVIELNEIIDLFNVVEKDDQIDDDIWKSDDILGWLYESYNNVKKKEFKDSGNKTEYDKVSLQSQVYTPRWVVEFLVNNSLGKLYLEMYPDSRIKIKHKIANAPDKQTRERKPLNEIKIIDPACGSGNFLLYAFDLFYELYLDQIEYYGADFDEDDIVKLIIENNLHGIDLDDRAVQLAQLGLYIKARQKNRRIGQLKFNVVSSDFFLPDYDKVKHIFENGSNLDDNQKTIIQEIWSDLQNAYKFGSLIKIDEKIKGKLENLFDEQDKLEKKGKPSLFISQTIQNYSQFTEFFFSTLTIAIDKYASKHGKTFLINKTKDAITFLNIVTTKYDVATANPPYTDSGDFGSKLKSFIESNYKKPYKFHTNLYATFIKRCFDFIYDHGYMAMVHPPTFMYIKTFEDVRKFIINKTQINFFVEWGYLGMFNPSARVDSALYILRKELNEKNNATFIKLNHLYETKRYDALFEAYNNYLVGSSHELLYSISQDDLKIIKSWPFIYWISDEFREKFGKTIFKDKSKVAEGLTTANNNRFLRYWWEIEQNYSAENKKWVQYAKGGNYNKYYGNMWTVLNWANNGNEIKNYKGASVRNENYYFQKGITFSSVGSKGVNYRLLEKGCIFDSASRSVFLTDSKDIDFILAAVNSKLLLYVAKCLNPTVSTTVGDVERLPFVIPNGGNYKIASSLGNNCVSIKKYLQNYSIKETNYISSPIRVLPDNLENVVKSYLNYENHLLTQVFINEAIINRMIFDIYNLTDQDKHMVLNQEGESIGGLPVSMKALDAYLNEKESTREFPLDNIKEFIESLPIKTFNAVEIDEIVREFPSLYQSNNDLEEFCIRHHVNPINIWYWFKESSVIPKQRMNDLAMEFLADMIREILTDDEDGIIPLVPNAGDKVLYDRLEEKFIEKGFSLAQYSSFDSVLGKPVNEYLNRHFFKGLSDHLNLFMYLPKTPFIWHLTSGPQQGFDCYIIIYKWSRDKLMRLRSVYIEHRERSLMNRQTDLADNESARAQNEKEIISKQIIEIESFKKKIDELLNEGYDPVLDDGVGKNIAPLQKKKMIAYDVLNAGQLKKYLNADW